MPRPFAREDLRNRRYPLVASSSPNPHRVTTKVVEPMMDLSRFADFLREFDAFRRCRDGDGPKNEVLIDLLG